MFIIQKDFDKNGVEQTRFKLTLGDCALIMSTPRDSEGNIIDFSLIKKVLFKLADDDMNYIFEKEFVLNEERQCYMFEFTSEESKVYSSDDRYRYEIEYTFMDDCVATPHSWYFQFMQEIV